LEELQHEARAGRAFLQRGRLLAAVLLAELPEDARVLLLAESHEAGRLLVAPHAHDHAAGDADALATVEHDLDAAVGRRVGLAAALLAELPEDARELLLVESHEAGRLLMAPHSHDLAAGDADALPPVDHDLDATVGHRIGHADARFASDDERVVVVARVDGHA